MTSRREAAESDRIAALHRTADKAERFLRTPSAATLSPDQLDTAREDVKAWRRDAAEAEASRKG